LAAFTIYFCHSAQRIPSSPGRGFLTKRVFRPSAKPLRGHCRMAAGRLPGRCSAETVGPRRGELFPAREALDPERIALVGLQRLGRVVEGTARAPHGPLESTLHNCAVGFLLFHGHSFLFWSAGVLGGNAAGTCALVATHDSRVLLLQQQNPRRHRSRSQDCAPRACGNAFHNPHTRG